MELHDLAQHRLSRSCGLVGSAIPENWRSRNVAYDEQTGCNGALSVEPSVRNLLCMDMSRMRRFTCRSFYIVRSLAGSHGDAFVPVGRNDPSFRTVMRPTAGYVSRRPIARVGCCVSPI
jgi:hypothetical protein